MKNIIKKLICAVLSLNLALPSAVMFTKETAYADESKPQNEQYYYHLDIGIAYYYYSNNKPAKR